MSEQAIKERLKLFNAQYHEFLASDFIKTTTESLGAEERLSEEQIELFQNAVGLYLLCFLDVEETVRFISEQLDLAPETARPLFGAVLSTLPPIVRQAIDEMFVALNEPGTDEPSDMMQYQQNNTPAGASQLPSVNVEQTYTSNQEDLLRQDSPPPQN